MDKEFLEFWGNYLLSVARGQRRMEDMAKWLQQGMQGFEDLTALFRQAYDLNTMTRNDSTDTTNVWEQSEMAFRKAFSEYLRAFGAVPLEEHQAVVEENKKLKDKIVEQEKTIQRLRMLVKEKGLLDPEEFAGNLEQIMKNQVAAFQKMMAAWQSEESD